MLLSLLRRLQKYTVKHANLGVNFVQILFIFVSDENVVKIARFFGVHCRGTLRRLKLVTKTTGWNH